MDERQLKELLGGAETPPAIAGAREQAVARALDAFDAAQQEKQKATQGSGLLHRLKDRLNNYRRSRSMTPRTLTQRYGFAGMATATAVLLAMVTYNTYDPYLGAEKEPQYVPEKSTAAEPTAPTTKPQERDTVLRAIAPRESASEQRQTRSAAGERESFDNGTVKTKPTPQPTPQMAITPHAAPPRAAAAPTQKRGVAGDYRGRADGALSYFGSAPKGLAKERALGQHLQSQQLFSDSQTGHYEAVGRDKFSDTDQNPINGVAEVPVSTFSIDVDTASYAFVRRMLNRGVLPQKNAVRVEELINYFPYSYPQAETREQPFQPTITVTPSPWKAGNKLIHVGIKGYDLQPAEKPRSNLVFLLDVSGSMNAPDKLPLMVNSLKLLLDTLHDNDTVSIVVYAGASGAALEPTSVAEKHKILAALDNLRAGGSTAGAAGIRQAYALAEGQFDKNAVNRVILATDGDFNVGITNREELKSFIERKRKTGIFLSVFGFGQGNLNDALMQTLAQNGNGVAAHIDTLNEARKVLVEEASSTFFPIAKDVKIQVEFNPKTVAEYRLIGYETRTLKREDFRNDKVDAGDIGAGHTVTAIYEITPTGSDNQVLDDTRYQQSEPAVKPSQSFNDEYAFLKIRYKLPQEDSSKLISTPITTAQETAPSLDAKWATAIAAFGQILKGGKYTGGYSYNDVIALAQSAKGNDEFGYRAEFINLVRLARSASASPR